ncbi:hypothetical protein NLG97_g1475 [Lecanicillium saksenae]|uniref:Uncharacterized protein n=1 Tax=Lecanicillium saksenae TaxID=468837 RepID=A0ACC1R3L4_9HYPO|nr:hypothetical protein NLG97_g1475 [Lecanicillium saksenae]
MMRRGHAGGRRMERHPSAARLHHKATPRAQRLVHNLLAGAGTRAGARGDAPALADHVYQLPDAKGDAGEDGEEDDDDDGDDVVALHHGGQMVWRGFKSRSCVQDRFDAQASGGGGGGEPRISLGCGE